MTRRIQALLLAAFTIFASFTPGSNASATVVVPLTQAQLVDRAGLIVQARVGEQRSQWNAEHTQIVTLTTLHVVRSLKGQAPATLTLRQFGGQVGQLVSRVSGDGRLQTGEQVVLFLRQRDGVVFLSALAQSVFHVRVQDGVPMAARDLSELTFAQGSSQSAIRIMQDKPAERAQTLASLVAEISRLVGGAR